MILQNMTNRGHNVSSQESFFTPAEWGKPFAVEMAGMKGSDVLS